VRKSLTIILLIILVAGLVSFSGNGGDPGKNRLRFVYAQSPDHWPRPGVEEGVAWAELGPLPAGPFGNPGDSLSRLIELGKALFFDPRLSASGTISCATCHDPAMNWTDGKEKSIGHEGAVNKRNSPTIQNTWFYKKLFWDGRARDLQDQAFAPIISESEMGSDMPDVMRTLRNIRGYKELFSKAYGTPGIDPDRMTGAIAAFEKTILSNKSRFDKFLAGDKKALSNRELRGLHLFRTKAKCMNCHNGPMFSDNQFHKSIFPAGDDKGLYKVTHKEEDTAKFKTPSLRDVMRTGPWGHDGVLKHMEDILLAYNKASPSPGGGKTRSLSLTKKELADLLSFLQAISAPPAAFEKPVLPE